MAELQGLRPLKEVKVDAHYALMNGAYNIYVQSAYNGDTNGQTYYAAKWLRMPAGDYTVRYMFDDSGQMHVDGRLVASGSHGGDGWNDPLTATFTIADDGVYRLDIKYQQGAAAAGSPAYACYEIKRGNELLEVSRAQDFIGDIVPIPDAALGPKPPFNQDVRLTYPVYLPKPDWGTSVIERLEWNTDVLVSETGAEQRRKLRQFPRRSFEAAFNAFGDHRSVIDSYLAGVGTRYGLLPIWHDEVPISGRINAGAVDVFAEIAYRDFNVNDVVIIRRDDWFDYELNIIAEKKAGQLVLAYGTQQDTPNGATITPVRVAQIRDQMGGSMLTDQVRQYSLRFYTIEAAAVTPEWHLPMYERTNIPILTLEPNYRESIDINYDRQMYPWDNEIGNVYIRDPGEQATTGLKFGYHVYGREDMYRFKQMLYKMSGRWREFHVPTGHDDIVLTRDIDGGQGAIVGKRNGYAQYLGANQVIRRDILIYLYDGTIIPNTIISSRAVGDEEWLFLSESVSGIPKDEVRRISYMPRGRLDIDAVEINRLTNADGVSQISLTFKTLNERRVAPPITF